ncbi:MAG TPA: dihydrolipoyl dehydrogenase [Thermoanaerobacterales bacterium]|nr:dihydrolipoyl dehydrogenase [Thermoanaerobacterales bacterium]
MNKHVIVIGGGPGGYVAAIRAAQLGDQVDLVDSGSLGGTCLNAGCIPTKTLLHTAQLCQAVKKEAESGLVVDNIRIDWNTLQKHKTYVVSHLAKGIAGLLKANNVTVHQGRAVLQQNGAVRIEGEKTAVMNADIIIMAVGSAPVKLKVPGADLPEVIDSTEALSLEKLPESLVIVGGGVIGTELAALYNALGTKVTVLEMMPRILYPLDGQIAALLRELLSKEGILFFTSSKLMEIRKTGKALAVRFTVQDCEKEIACEKVLVAVGRKPNTENLGLEALGIKTEKGAIIVDQHFVTSIPWIYAVGDCNGNNMLAHAASAQGIAAVEHAHGKRVAYRSDVVPKCIYTNPEVASVGLTEDQVKSQGIPYKVGLFPLAGNGKSLIEGCKTGLIKIIADARYGEILGAHLMGPRVTEIIGEIALAMTMEATAQDLLSTIHPHPSVSEALAEAAHGVFGNPIHWPPVKNI